MATSSGVDRGLVLQKLDPGATVDVETKSRHYHIECLGGSRMRISGHPLFCPEPVVAELRGSVDGIGELEPGVIREDKRLVFLLENRPVMTSKILHVHVTRTDSPAPISNN
jgi:hypothetical protein